MSFLTELGLSNLWKNLLDKLKDKSDNSSISQLKEEFNKDIRTIRENIDDLKEDINNATSTKTFETNSNTVSSAYKHNQLSASNQWIIKHDLNKYPSVTVVDSAGTTVFGDVTYVSTNKLIIYFNGEFSGKAYLN